MAQSTRQPVNSGLAIVMPKAANAKPAPKLIELVRIELDNWSNWVNDTKRGVMTPVQFLAVVLWILSDESTTDEDEVLIVEGWGKALLDAVARRIVVALHPVTLLPISNAGKPDNWRLSIMHADQFLESMPIGFECRKALACWCDEAAGQGAGDATALTYDQAKKQRIDGKNSTWTRPQLEAVNVEIKRRNGEKGLWARVALELDITEQTLRSNLKKSSGQTRPGNKSNRTLTAGNVALPAAWGSSNAV